jgi:Protein of unknown function (DUF2815)
MNITLNNVRLSFPALWEPRKGPDATSKPAYQAAFILDKKDNAAEITAVKAAIAAIVKDSFKGKQPPKIALRDGAEKPDVDGYGETVMFINSRSDKRPHVIGRKMEQLAESDGKPYAGCYVNASIRLWAQDNQYGKRINAQLRAVQFVKDGDEFGDSAVDVNKEFKPLDEEDVI